MTFNLTDRFLTVVPARVSEIWSHITRTRSGRFTLEAFWAIVHDSAELAAPWTTVLS
jgi:hypothetical protein